MKNVALIVAVAAVCMFGRPAVSHADDYNSCVRDYVSQCQSVKDEWESCRELYSDIVDMCRSAYPMTPRKHR